MFFEKALKRAFLWYRYRKDALVVEKEITGNPARGFFDAKGTPRSMVSRFSSQPPAIGLCSTLRRRLQRPFFWNQLSGAPGSCSFPVCTTCTGFCLFQFIIDDVTPVMGMAGLLVRDHNVQYGQMLIGVLPKCFLQGSLDGGHKSAAIFAVEKR